MRIQYWKARRVSRGQDIAGAKQSFQSGIFQQNLVQKYFLSMVLQNIQRALSDWFKKIVIALEFLFDLRSGNSCAEFLASVVYITGE